MESKTHIGNCVDLVKTLDDKSIDLVITYIRRRTYIA